MLEKIVEDCYLTKACMAHYKENFNDNCEELTVIRNFRNRFVSKKDIEHYYEVAPMIVAAIDKLEDSNKVYNYIYDRVVSICVNAIKEEDYIFAYNKYKASILSLEEKFIYNIFDNFEVRRK